MINCKSVNKSFSGTKVLHDITFTISENKTLGVLGPNGAGKSTTLKILSTLLKPDHGKIAIDGLDIITQAELVRTKIAYLPEAPPLYPELTVREYLKLFAKLKGVESNSECDLQVEEKISLCRLSGYENKLCGILSKGYRQKVGLASALMGSPKILLLDEPTSGLDPKEIVEIRALVKTLKKNHTILFSSHILSEVSEICDEVVMFMGGRTVLQSSLEELASKGGIEKVFLNVLEGAANA